MSTKMMKYAYKSEFNDEKMKTISSWIKSKHTEMTGEETEELFVEYVTVMITNAKSMEEISKDLLDLEMFEEKDAKVFALALGEQLMKLDERSSSSSSSSSGIVANNKNNSNSNNNNNNNTKKEKKDNIIIPSFTTTTTATTTRTTTDKKIDNKIKDRRVNDLLDKPLGTSRDGKTINGGNDNKRSITDRLGDVQDIGVSRKRGFDNQYDHYNKRERGPDGPMNMNPMAMMMDPNLMKEQMNLMAQMSGFSSLEDMMKFNQELMKKMESGELGNNGFPGRGFSGRGSDRGRGRFSERGRGRGRGGMSTFPIPKEDNELEVAPPKSTDTVGDTNTDPKENIDEIDMTHNDFEFLGDGTFDGRGGRGRGGRFSGRGRGRFDPSATRGGRGRGRGPAAASKNKVWVREPTLDSALPGTITSKLMK